MLHLFGTDHKVQKPVPNLTESQSSYSLGQTGRHLTTSVSLEAMRAKVRVDSG